MARFAGAQLTLVRVDTGKGDQNVVVFRRQFSDFLVLVAAIAGFALSIDREDHRRNVLLAIVRGGFRHGGRMLPGRPEIVGHGGLQLIIAVIGMAAAGLFGVGVNIDRTDLGEIYHRLCSCQSFAMPLAASS